MHAKGASDAECQILLLVPESADTERLKINSGADAGEFRSLTAEPRYSTLMLNNIDCGGLMFGLIADAGCASC